MAPVKNKKKKKNYLNMIFTSCQCHPYIPKRMFLLPLSTTNFTQVAAKVTYMSDTRSYPSDVKELDRQTSRTAEPLCFKGAVGTICGPTLHISRYSWYYQCIYYDC